MVGEILSDEFYGIVLRKGEEGLLAGSILQLNF
ncbi:MAG: hypothetical protein CM1200mP16_16070 [Nitrospina sp.]|nr:MAG: hypothetical protein CM1200mP16_16070 [Nitrospina sp.]